MEHQFKFTREKSLRITQQAPNSLSFGKRKTMKTRMLLRKTTKIEAKKDKFVLINKKKRQISVFLFEFKP